MAAGKGVIPGQEGVAWRGREVSGTLEKEERETVIVFAEIEMWWQERVERQNMK